MYLSSQNDDPPLWMKNLSTRTRSSEEEETYIGARDQPKDRERDKNDAEKRAASAKKRKETLADKRQRKALTDSEEKSKGQSKGDRNRYDLKRTAGKSDGDIGEPAQKKSKKHHPGDEENNDTKCEVQVAKGEPDEMIIIGIDLGTTYSGKITSPLMMQD